MSDELQVAHGIHVNADGMVGPTVVVPVPPEPPPPARRRSATAAPVEDTPAAAALGEHYPERVGNEPLVHICAAFVVVAAAGRKNCLAVLHRVQLPLSVGEVKIVQRCNSDRAR
eukprot:COSAG03_NODE_8509_length_796_cov_1.348637_1_plen_114_part_00